MKQPLTSERREAIGRARRAVERLAIDPEATLPARSQAQIVNDFEVFNDREAGEALAALEYMVLSRGLVSPQQIEAERRAAAVAILMGEEVAR